MTQMSVASRLTLAALLACGSLQALSQSSYTLDEDLKHSQFCAKAAVDFRKRPEWSNDSEPHVFTNHFNKVLGKCLVMVVTSTYLREQKAIFETSHVYDALEGTVLGGKITSKTTPRTNDRAADRILMVRDGKTIGRDSPDEAREAYRWFESLMKD